MRPVLFTTTTSPGQRSRHQSRRAADCRQRAMLVGLGGRQVVAGDDCHAVVDFDLDDFIDDGGVRAELLQERVE